MHGMGKARYRGQRRVLLQARLTAAVVNIKKLFTLEIPTVAAAHARPHQRVPVRPDLDHRNRLPIRPADPPFSAGT
jgi:hypothetical protein